MRTRSVGAAEIELLPTDGTRVVLADRVYFPMRAERVRLFCGFGRPPPRFAGCFVVEEVEWSGGGLVCFETIQGLHPLGAVAWPPPYKEPLGAFVTPGHVNFPPGGGPDSLVLPPGRNPGLWAFHREFAAPQAAEGHCTMTITGRVQRMTDALLAAVRV